MIDMYSQNILEHYSEPRNFGKLENYSHHARELNPFCGDDFEIFLKIEDNIVNDVKFSGDGCAISKAGISMLTSEIKGKNVQDVKNINKDDVFKKLGVNISQARIKCALMGLSALNAALTQKNA